MAGEEVLLHRRVWRSAGRRPQAARRRRARRAILAFNGGDAYDRVLGRTYNEISGEARSMHKCQGMSQLLPLPAGEGNQGPGGLRGYRLRDTVLADGVNRNENDLFDGIDTRIASLAAFAGAQPPAELTSRLERIQSSVNDARAALAKGGGTAAVPALLRGLADRSRTALDGLATMALDGRREVRDRSAAEAQGHAVRRRRCCWPPTSGSRPSRATAWSSPVSPCRSICWPPIAARVVPVMMSRRSLGGFEVKGELCKDDALMRGPDSRQTCTVTARFPPMPG